MNAVHLNPGYHSYEGGLSNALRQPQYLNSSHYNDDTKVDRATLDQLAGIKTWARNVWSQPDLEDTTYRFQYCTNKKLLERTKSAPTEDLRKNNPHPKQIFLTNRLHYVPGYHNADAALGKPQYQIDASCGPDEQAYRSEFRSKYKPEISTDALRQYAPSNKDDNEITKWNRTLPPNDSWMASSSFGAQPGVNKMTKSLDEAIADAAQTQANNLASHNRYLRLAGADERMRIQRALDARHDIDKIPNMMVPHQASGTIGTRRQTDRSNWQAQPHKPLYRFPRPRGDFLIHPVWPPSMWHHRIPGFKPDPPSRGTMSAYEHHQRTRLDGVY